MKVTKRQMKHIDHLPFGGSEVASTWVPDTLPSIVPGPIALDFEYDPNDDPTRCKPFAYSVYSPELRKGWYVPWASLAGPNVPKEGAMRWLVDVTSDRDVYGLNMKAEIHSMYNLGYDPRALGLRPHDVAFPPTLLDEERVSGFSLEALAQEWLPDEERKVHLDVDPGGFKNVSSDKMSVRCISDSYLAWRIYEKTRTHIVSQKLERVNKLEDDCIIPVVRMERRGALIDRVKLERWIFEIDRQIEQLCFFVKEQTGVLMTTGGPKILQAIFNKIGHSKPSHYNEFTKETEDTWGVDALKTVEHPVIASVVKILQLRSIRSKYLIKYLHAIDGNNILRFPLHQLRSTKDEGGDEIFGTCTGRFSCGGNDWKINVQQVMKCEKQIESFGPDFIVRELFIAEPGKIVSASDASQIEFRLFSHYAAALGYKGTALRYAADPHIDFHMLVTKMMNPGVTDEKILKAKRKHMKHNNFGVLYGMGRSKLARRLDLPCHCDVNWYEKTTDERTGEERYVRSFKKNQFHETECPARQANDIMDEYDHEFPEARKLLRLASDTAESRQYVCTIMGRRGRFPYAQKLHKAFNKIVQGSAADYFKIKLVELDRSNLVDLRMPVHDEFVYDIEPGPKQKQTEELLNEQSLKLHVPLLWDTGYGANWKEANGA